jgi:hypothetical protein
MVGPWHGLFHSIWGLLLLITLLGVTITAFSRFMFHTIAQLQSNVEELSRVAESQNTQMRALNEANLALAEEKSVSSVLQRVVDLSREAAAGASLGGPPMLRARASSRSATVTLPLPRSRAMASTR